VSFAGSPTPASYAPYANRSSKSEPGETTVRAAEADAEAAAALAPTGRVGAVAEDAGRIEASGAAASSFEPASVSRGAGLRAQLAIASGGSPSATTATLMRSLLADTARERRAPHPGADLEGIGRAW
jgi:hypothetical protein